MSQIVEVTSIEGGKTLDYTDLKSKLLELQPGLVFDEGSGENAYVWNSEGKMRVGLFYGTRYICAMEHGVMPEFSIYDSEADYEVPCKIQEVLNDPSERSYFLEVAVNKQRDPVRHFQLDCFLGIEGGKGLTNSQGSDTFVFREQSGDIIVASPMKIVSLPSRTLRIGWREVLELIVRSQVLTAEALEKKFNIHLVGATKSSIQLDLAIKDLPRIGVA